MSDLNELATLTMIERDPKDFKCSDCVHYIPEGVMPHAIDGPGGVFRQFPARCRRADFVRGDGYHAERCDDQRRTNCGPFAFYWEPKQ